MTRPLHFSRFILPLVAATVCVPLRASAQQRDPAAAQALFDEATRLAASGGYPEACAKFAESNRLDPGIGTQFHLSDCYEQSGRFASAWAGFLEVASQARASGQSDRERAALARAGKLEARLPKLSIEVPEDARVRGLEVRRDGILVGEAQWGTLVPVDPGDHVVVASAPGKVTVARTVHAEVGKRGTYTVPLLEDGADDDSKAGAAAVGAAGGVDAGNSDPPASKTAPREDSSAGEVEGGGPNPLVYALAGVGVVGLGVGTAFALMAKSSNEDSKAECRKEDPNLCTQTGVEQRDDARSQGNIATAGFVVGGAALATAVVWFFVDGGGSSKSARRVTPIAELGPGRAALSVAGSF